MEADKKNVKEKRYSVRLTKDMERLFKIVANERGITVGRYLRDAGLAIAEMSIDEKGLAELIDKKDRDKFQKTFHMHLQETKDLVVNSSQRILEELSDRIGRVENFLEIFLYVYLYHTPEVKDIGKDSAKKSAQDRKKKVMSVIKNTKNEKNVD
ncbi:MAG: hypothetical protein KC733_08300 [Candidatus Omnitrophica bacterium]|nr:hypothetical protein [Candidatus Omnitrophota bacterium]